MLLDRIEQPVKSCADPECRWAALPPAEHFDRHNPPCAQLFVGHDGTELICELLRGHEGAHRGVARR